VPPPPPPGFGDAEYYSLYGEPEEYQRYTAEVERSRREERPQHEEYSVYRRYTSHEEAYDYYYGPAGGESSSGRRPRRIAPPPPAGFSSEGSRSPPPSRRKRRKSRQASSDSEDGPEVFHNFRVTIKQETDGTPSLSDSDGSKEKKKARKRKKRQKEREREKRRRLEKKLAKREQELQQLSQQQTKAAILDLKRRTEAEQGGGTRKSIKERLGDRKGAENKSLVKIQKEKPKSPARLPSADQKRDDLLRRAEVRRQNQERSPLQLQSKSGEKRNRRGRSQSLGRSNSRRKLSRSRSRKLEGRRSRLGRRSPSPDRKLAGTAVPRKKKPRRRQRDRDRDRRRGRAGVSRQQMEDMQEENREMRARLEDRAGKAGRAGRVEDRLALLAGQAGGAGGAQETSEESDSGSEDGESRSRVRKLGKMRSDAVEDREAPDPTIKSDDKWEHDKFEQVAERDKSPETENETEKSSKFGKHWNKIRSDRSKERGRRRSGSRTKSRSRKHRSWSKSASRSGSRVARKRRRRGKFSRSLSRSVSSSSESSRSRSGSRSPVSRSASPTSQLEPLVKVEHGADKPDKEGVQLGLSGVLAADTNTVNGTLAKYSEPPEARKPKTKWRLYVFKGNEELPILYIHRQSAYLLGRDRKVADVPLDHPSCSKQHSALQYRLVPFTRPDGSEARRVQLYIMDLQSQNGTFVNNNKIEPAKYVQLIEKDVLKFGFSSREYVLLHDQSKEDEEDLGVD